VRRLSEVAPGVLVRTSSFELTTSTVVVGAAAGCLLIDPGVTVAELAQLAAELRELGLRPAAAWSTHPHWDHVLWSSGLGDAPRYATSAAVAAAGSWREEMISRVQEEAPGHDLELFGRLTRLPAGTGHIRWDGPATQVIAHNGHAPGHAAVFLPDAGVLMAGDMLSDIEIPLLDIDASDPLGDYRAGLRLLAAVPGVRLLVPGHGHVAGAAEYRTRLDADTRYLDLLAAGEPFDDPRCTQPWLRDWHRRQLQCVAGFTDGDPG